MEIRRVPLKKADEVFELVQKTVDEIYPRFYHAEAVAFFKDWHARHLIYADIMEGKVFAAVENGEILGTVTLSGDHMSRLFVSPEFQGKGYGGKLLAFAEEKIGKDFGKVFIYAAQPALAMYLKKGYVFTGAQNIPVDNGKEFVALTMEKALQ